jgi:GH43 family beta-xylosidase
MFPNLTVRCAAVLCIALLAGAALAQQTFRNPLLPSGPDPWMTEKDGTYYFMSTTGVDLTIWMTKNPVNLRNAEKRIVWTPPAAGPYSHDIWAPELHFLNGKWYIYFAGDPGTNQQHRIWVLENASPDPLQGQWTMKGKLAAPDDKWAIDGSVFENQGKLYAIWSGWPDDANGTQNIYIAEMSNPWSISSNRTLLSTPQYPWEKVGDANGKLPAGDPPHIDVNEGPEALLHNDMVFVIYSASACWTDFYSLGLLSVKANSNLLDPASWTKSPQPVFQTSASAHAFAPGHNSFFRSPDGKEDWLLYHANSNPRQGCGEHRAPRAQRFTWKADGTPDFGTPVPIDTPIAVPSH